MAQIVNRKQAASYCGVSLPTLDAWVKKGCPYVQRGSKGKEWKFDLALVSAWRDRYVAKPNEVVVDGAAIELDSREQAAVVSAVGNLIARVGKITAEMIVLAGGSIETAYAAEQLVTIKLSDVAEEDLEGRKFAPLDLMEMFCLRQFEVDWDRLAKEAGLAFDPDVCDAHMTSLDDKWTCRK